MFYPLNRNLYVMMSKFLLVSLLTLVVINGQEFKETTSMLNSTDATSAAESTTTEAQTEVFEISTCPERRQDVLLEGTEGRIECSFPINDGQSRDLVWRVRPRPAGYGLVLHFHQYNSSTVVEFDVYGSHGNDDETSEEEKFTVTSAPLLVAHRQARIVIKSAACRFFFCRNLLKEPFSFNVTYSAHPLGQMPVPISLPPLVEVALPSATMYNCSDPYTVPEGLKCDMIQQCVGGEDEDSECSYRSEGCQQDWVPLGDQCVKLVIIDKREDNLEMVSTRQLCKAKFDALPAVFPGEEGRDLVNILYRRSGQRTGLDSKISLGLTKATPKSDKLSHLYRFVWQWGGDGGPMALQEAVFQRLAAPSDCAALFVLDSKASLLAHSCTLYDSAGYVCMKPNTLQSAQVPEFEGLALLPTSQPLNGFQTKLCSDGSHVQTFHPCPLGSKDNADHWTVSHLPLFQCTLGHGIHYTLVCDGNPDCSDGSDEMNCARANVPSSFEEYFICRRMQVIPAESECNGINDCFDKSDEQRCEFCNGNSIRCSDFGCVLRNYSQTLKPCDADNNYRDNPNSADNFPPPAVVTLDGFGFSRLTPISEGEECPETHFRCADGYCIPTYLINNGEQDCLHGEDEGIPQGNFTCPGFYRCFETGSCVHPDLVCDGVHHCPNKDDERYCNLPCPENCTCEGHALTCQQMFNPRQYLHVRYLDLSGADNPSLEDVHFMPFLHFLNLSRCNLTNVTLTDIPLLQILDLSFNELRDFENLHLQDMSGLMQVDLSHNPFVPELGYSFTIFTQRADMSGLGTLQMTEVGLKIITSNVFAHVAKLTSLDLRGNPIEKFDADLFRGLNHLEELQADDPRLCCDAFHGDTKLTKCSAPVDELSSCSDLLRSDFFRVFLWVVSCLAISGNAGVLIYRLFLEKERTSQAYRILIINLSVSDLLMGVYVAVIGVADARFRGDYVSREAEWKQSDVCTMAGVFAFVSCEVSAFAICLITLDRCLALRFPFGSRLRLNKLSAGIVCCTTWVVGLALAVVPIFQTSWTFYGQTSICIPLPVTRQVFPGHDYSFGVFIVLNFVLFLFTGVGQVFIFTTVRSSARATKQDNRQNELVIARRLFAVVATDFCCWFPIGLMGLLASGGTPLPGVVTVWVAIFVLPLNSALNPFLYTLNTLRERQAKKTARRRIEKMSSNLHAELRSWPRDKVESLVRHCLKSGLVDTATAVKWLDTPRGTSDPVVAKSETEDSSTNIEKPASEKMDQRL